MTAAVIVVDYLTGLFASLPLLLLIVMGMQVKADLVGPPARILDPDEVSIGMAAYLLAPLVVITAPMVILNVAVRGYTWLPPWLLALTAVGMLLLPILVDYVLLPEHRPLTGFYLEMIYSRVLR